MSQELRLAASAVAAAMSDPSTAAIPPSQRFINGLHHYSRVIFTLSFLLVAVIGIEVGGHYWSARTLNAVKPAVAAKATAPTIAGLNLTVPAKDLQAKLQTITNQPATLTVGDQTIPVGADTISSWLQITASANKSEDYIRIKAGTIAASLQQLANQFVKAPVNQVSVSEDGVGYVIVGGRNGTALTDPNSLKTQADQVAKTVMDGKGLQFNTPLQTLPFQSVTPVAFDKLLVVNVSTKKMWAYQNGQEVNSWLVSAGSAIHGVYWHPLSWFGANNSSHGCVGVPDDQAQWIYDWAPIGTTVITHA